MKKTLLIGLLFASITILNAQKIDFKENALKASSEKACKCMDSISSVDKKSNIINNIKSCIEKELLVYSVTSSFETIDLDKLMKENVLLKDTVIENGSDTIYTNSPEKYKELEDYVINNCLRMRFLIGSEDTALDIQTQNKEAMKWYDKGIAEDRKGNYTAAIKYYEKAVKEDPDFAYAWDNLGVDYRKNNELDKAIEAYQNSLKAIPYGKTPLLNIAVVYRYKEEYDKAIEAYETFNKAYPGDVEVSYGLGQTYGQKGDYEKALDYMCKAYVMYMEQQSPYRSDAEGNIQYLYNELKKQGKEDVFHKVLKDNKISEK